VKVKAGTQSITRYTLNLNPWPKARARVGEALTALGRHTEASRAYTLALKLEPGRSAASPGRTSQGSGATV